jgi:hypothetical protein
MNNRMIEFLVKVDRRGGWSSPEKEFETLAQACTDIIFCGMDVHGRTAFPEDNSSPHRPDPVVRKYQLGHTNDYWLFKQPDHQDDKDQTWHSYKLAARYESLQLMWVYYLLEWRFGGWDSEDPSFKRVGESDLERLARLGGGT